MLARSQLATVLTALTVSVASTAGRDEIAGVVVRRVGVQMIGDDADSGCDRPVQNLAAPVAHARSRTDLLVQDET
jgi:hypothetical protein